MRMTTSVGRLPATLLLAAMLPATAMAGPKAGDDASTNAAAISYCAKQGETVQSASFTSASTISVTCTRQPTKGSTTEFKNVPTGATYTEVLGNSSAPTEYNWTLPATLFAVMLTIAGNVDSTSSTTGTN